MKKLVNVVGILCFVLFMIAAKPGWAAHPLITDDTGTQGKGKFQIELSGEYEHDDDDGVKSKVTTVASAFSTGLTDTIDLVLGVPFQFSRASEDTDDGHEVTTEEGISDVSAEIKWRFFEREGLSFALKPGVTFPTGDRDKELGGDRMTYSLYLISTLEAGPTWFHANVGYIQNENKDDDRRELWQASLAMEYAAAEKLKLVANIGVDRNPEIGTETNPAFILGGVIYSLTDYLDVDMGVKGGLNDVSPDYSILAGLTWSFL
jgi:hypothetical protein